VENAWAGADLFIREGRQGRRKAAAAGKLTCGPQRYQTPLWGAGKEPKCETHGEAKKNRTGKKEVSRRYPQEKRREMTGGGVVSAGGRIKDSTTKLLNPPHGARNNSKKARCQKKSFQRTIF